MDRWTLEDRIAHEEEMRAQGAVSAGAIDALFRLTKGGLTLAQAQDAILRELRGLVDRPHVHREGRTLSIPVPGAVTVSSADLGPNAAPAPRRPPPPPPLGGRLAVPGASIPGVLPPPIPPPPRVQAPDLDLSDVGGGSPPPLVYEE